MNGVSKTQSSRKIFPLLPQIGAIGLAVILWFFVISESTFDATLEFPIVVRNIPEGKALQMEVPLTASVRFRGSGRTLTKLYLLRPFSDVKLVIDLERVSRRHVFYLDDYFHENPDRISIPIIGVRDKLTLIEIVEPDSVPIILDEYAQKSVSVEPDITLDILAGYTQVGKIGLYPETVMIEGAAESIKKITALPTERRAFRNVSQPVRVSIPLIHPNERLVDVNAREVEIRVDVQMIGERRVIDIPIEVLNVPRNLNVYVGPSTASITLIGGVDRLAALEPGDVRVIVDYRKQWSPENLFVEPTVKIGPDILEYRDLVPSQLEIITTRDSP